jgi:Tol biopolymer transport system component
MLSRRSLLAVLLFVAFAADASLTGGKVVFTSNRTGKTQLYVKVPGSVAPPVKITSGFYDAQHPHWSPNGEYIAYITRDVITGGGNSELDVLSIIDESGALMSTVPMFKFTGAAHLGYPQWAEDGQRIVLTYFLANGERGLGLITFPGPYQFGNPPATKILMAPGPAMNPGEAIFSRDGLSIYFSGDNGGPPAQLFRMPAGGGSASPVLGDGKPVRRFFAPCVSPDGLRLMYNSELWKEDTTYLDEEILELNLPAGSIARITKEPGHQYGCYAAHGAGELVVQSNAKPSDPYALFLQEGTTRVPLDVASMPNTKDGSPDWWKPPCACVAPPPLIAGWWTFDETSGTIAKDQLATSANGTLIGGATRVPGMVNRALWLNGSSAYVEVPNVASLNPGAGNVSIDAWVKIDALADVNGVRVLVEKRADNPWRGYSFFLYNGRLGVQLADGTASNFISTIAVPADKAWHLVAVTVERANVQGVRFYLDGAPVGVALNPTARAGSLSNTAPLRIGSLTQSPGSLFRGAIDELEVIRRVLTPAEVKGLYAASTCGKCK